ncbi:hypothetical protein JJB07_15270 [Tumebacillus sp. ITR2]|uniref:Uncharacterized protein n=1 Tax=Tumebacillus amylolyticus TaxID=2801339 RepID=A0ABS1JCL4_9BACL|nr:hypothetical protein [Tumebacillus amylolyticus]MBL0387989.1 hypothetical protein [Tumebacillus amylolyticus]
MSEQQRDEGLELEKSNEGWRINASTSITLTAITAVTLILLTAIWATVTHPETVLKMLH